MRVGRWLRWAGLAAALAVVLILIASWGASRSAWGRNEVRQLIEQQAARALDGTLTIRSVSGSIVNGVTLEGVRFVHREREVFTAESIDARFSLWGWLRGAREISSLRVVAPVIRLAEQHQNWDAAAWIRPSTGPAGPPTRVRLPLVEIVNGRLLSSANETVWRLPADITSINGRFALTVGGGTRVEIARLSFDALTGGPAIRVRAMTGAMTFASDVRLERVRVESDAGTLSADGRIGPPGPRTLDVRAVFEQFATAKWRRFTPLLDTVDLSANGTAAFGGDMDRLTVKTALTTSAGALKGDALFASSPTQLRITGTADTVNFDAQRVTGDPLWASSLTGHGRYTVVSTGSPSHWTSEIKINGGPVKGFGASFERLDGVMHYAARAVTFDTNAVAYGASGHANGTIRVGDEVTIDVAGDRLSHLDPRKIPAEWGYLPLDADLNASSFAVHWTPREWTLRATLDESVAEGATMLSGMTVELSGTKTSLAVAAAGDVRSLDARRMGRATGLVGLDDPIFVTSLNGHVTLSGQGPNLTDIDLVAHADLKDSTLAGGATVPQAAVDYTRQSHRSTAHVVGLVGALNPTAFGASEALVSALNGRTDFVAAWRDDVTDIPATMTARGTFWATASVISALPVDSGVVTGEWRDGAFTAESATLENKGVVFTGRGRVAITAGTSSATFEVNAADVAPLEPWTGRAAHGAMTGRGDLSGTFDLPRVRATFQSPQVTDPALETLIGISGDADVVFPDWFLDKMRGDVRVLAKAWTGAAGPIADAVSLHGVFTTRMSVSTAEVEATANQMRIRATLSADWSGETTADIKTLDATRGAQVWRLDPASGRLQVTATHLIATNVQLSSGPQRITLAGRVALSTAETGGDAGDQLSMRLVNIDLAALDEMLGMTTHARGLMSGDVSLVGRLSDPRGHITLSGRDLAVDGYRIAEAGGTIDLADGAATSALSLKQPDGVELLVNGRAPLSWLLPAGVLDAAVPSPSWDLTLVSDPINLEILAPIVPSLTEFGGQAIVDLRIVGAAASPSVTGTLAIAEGRFRIPKAGTAFSHVTADFGFGVDTVTVRRFVASDQHGHQLKITGELAMSERQLNRVNVNVEADRVSIIDNAIGVIELSSLLQLKGDVGHPVLTGNVEVSSGRVEVDRLLRALQGDASALVAEANLPAEGTTLVDLRADAAAAAAAEAARKPAKSAFDSRSFLSRLSVDVQVLAPDNLTLRGSKLRPGGKNSWSLGDLNVTVGGDLQATRAPGDLVKLNGDVTMVRGVYSFENRRFDIQRGGRIRFQGESPLDPTFDIRGVRSVQGVEARVDVRGRLSAPTLQLGSNVPLSESDVLSMIIFNRPVNQLGDTQRADLVGAAASLAGGYVTAPLTQSLSRALDLDLLEVETVSFGQNVAPRVRIGQRLTSRLFVQLSQQFGAQSLTEVTAEFQLLKSLRLQGSTAQGPGSTAQRSLVQRVERLGLDLLFFFNY